MVLFSVGRPGSSAGVVGVWGQFVVKVWRKVGLAEFDFSIIRARFVWFCCEGSGLACTRKLMSTLNMHNNHDWRIM